MAPSSRVYPKLYQNILQAMPENVTIVWENSLDERARPRNQWVTNVMGRFTCRNRQCASGGWFSRTVGIWIRQFRGGRYNAIVYNQECELCFTKSRSGLAILQESIAALLLGRNSASEEGFKGAFSH
ncbi:hypothetical protein MCOR03_009348 [Pyricularia oryzae]|nr:hypothetical protein MCOR03_009348 [Pyricularia oryzae]